MFFDDNLMFNISRLQDYIDWVIYWKNDGAFYKAKIQSFKICPDDVYIICKRIVFNTLHEFKLSDYNKKWYDKFDRDKIIDWYGNQFLDNFQIDTSFLYSTGDK